jgi:hypothetical protein
MASREGAAPASGKEKELARQPAARGARHECAVVFLLYLGAALLRPASVSLLLSYALAPLVRRAHSASCAIARSPRALVVALDRRARARWGRGPGATTSRRMWQKLPAAAKTISKSLQKMAQRRATPSRK